MKRILLPTDFSRNAVNAIDYSQFLFEKEMCIFYFLNASQVGPSGLSEKYNKERETRLYKITMQESRQKLNDLVQVIRASNTNPKHSFESLPITDLLLNAIGRNVIDKNVDYIFMGTKGASGIKEIFMGSNTVNVIKNINFCPLVAVPEAYDYDIPDEILFATDFEHFYETEELTPLFDIVKLWNSALVVVHINKEKELSEFQIKSKEMLKRKLKGITYRFQDVEMSSSISSIINHLAKQNSNIGMVSLLNRKHGFFRKLIREPVVKKVAFKSLVPFLVLPEIL
ncbi:MAG: universal stress protein [Maribacter sp.]|nr:universal stress protein [Maribacter sp.]